MKTVHLIQHTHWDREWYFTENDSRALLYYFMDDLMTRLEADEQIGPFVLDAQTVIIDDYLEIAPENKTRLEKLIKQGRILIGPWYTQTDFLVVGAESIARNLLLGIQRAKQLGPVMMVGYIPDSFGQCAQLPMYLQQFGIKRAVFWRGWSEEFVKNTEFRWRSEDGSEILAGVLPWGYGCAKWLPTDVKAARDIVIAACDKQSRFAATNHIMLPNGNDQSPFEYKVPHMLAQLNELQDDYQFKCSSFDAFFDALEIKRDELEIYEGELLSPKYMRIHRGIFTTRMDIKLANARLEQLLTQQLEPLLSVNWQLGLPYPANALEKIWLEAMKSHAHDSIGACNSDRVNQMALGRLQSGIEMAEQLLDLNLRKLCQGIQAEQKGTKIVLFNSLPRVRSGLIPLSIYTPATDFAIVDANGKSYRYQIVEEGQQDMATIIQDLANRSESTLYRSLSLLVETPDIPACGFLTLYLQENEVGQITDVTTETQQAVIENTWLKLSLDNGKLHLFDKRNQTTYPDLLQLVDGGDDGDNYNYSPPKVNWLISSKDSLPEWHVECGELVSKLVLHYSLAVPSNLKQRRKKIADAQLPITLTLSVPHHAAQLEIDITMDNQICDHRLQLHVSPGLFTRHHYADQQFGLIPRSNQPAEMALWQQQEWTEAPVALYPMQSLVVMNNAQQGIAVVTDGIREYEILTNYNPHSFAITLLRSVGWLGKKDLVYRPGRASGMVLPSPDSQLPGVWQQRLCLIPQTADIQQPEFWQQVENWRTPLVSHVDTSWPRFRLNAHDKKFPAQFSLLQWSSPLCFSSLKKAEQSDALVLRLYNPTLTDCEIEEPEVDFNVRVSNLAEQPGTEFDISRHDSVGACAPLTLLLTKKGGKR